MIENSSKNSVFWQKILSDKAHAYFMAIGPLVFSVVLYYDGKEQLISWRNFFITVLLAVLMLYNYICLKYKSNKDASGYGTQLSPVFISVVDILLRQFSENKLGFKGGQKNSDRITIYIHEESSNRFIPFGRYSPDSEFDKQLRTSYPNEGCIARGWKKGWCFDDKGIYRINKKDSRGVRMKSKLYVTTRISLGSKNLAVLVVESENVNRFSERQIKKILKDESDQDIYYLAELIEKLYYNIPTPSDAEGAEL